MCKINKISYFFLSLLCIQTACTSGDYEASLQGKAAYAVLEAQKASLEAKPTTLPYVFTANSNGSGFDTLAFPVKADDGKYFLIIANAKRKDEILKVWKKDEARFHITRSTFEDIRQKGYASETALRYLRAQVSN
jgi:hypothetical protein